MYCYGNTLIHCCCCSFIQTAKSRSSSQPNNGNFVMASKFWLRENWGESPEPPPPFPPPSPPPYRLCTVFLFVWLIVSFINSGTKNNRLFISFLLLGETTKLGGSEINNCFRNWKRFSPFGSLCIHLLPSRKKMGRGTLSAMGNIFT